MIRKPLLGLDIDTHSVVLVGNPNTGKTSVFNALTGLRQKVGNYPGVTVERKTGVLISPQGGQVNVIDLPGLYSLSPKSIDEKIAADALTLPSEDPHSPGLIVAVADASNLNRNLFLISQLMDLGKPLLIALNMTDIARANGAAINVETLSGRLGVPVIEVNGNKRLGITELRRTIFDMLAGKKNAQAIPGWQKHPDVSEYISPLVSLLSARPSGSENTDFLKAYRLIKQTVHIPADQPLTHLLNGETTPEILQALRDLRSRLGSEPNGWQRLETRARYEWIDGVCDEVVCRSEAPRTGISQRIDTVLTHRLFGPVFFLFLFALIFQSIFSWAEMPMEAIDTGISWLGSRVSSLLPEGALRSLIVDGAIGGVGAILVFLPQILFLFFFLSLLEDSGYMTRIAFMLDRFMRGVGLSGRSAIPLLSSFACAIPGIMATRTISNWRERLLTIMIAPLMSCSARLPVYTLMIGAFIPDVRIAGLFSLAGLTLLAMYLLGIGSAIGAALVFKRIIMRGRQPASFMMELPPYRLPSLRWTFLQMWERAKIFITDAGKVILAMSLILWFLASYPKIDTVSADNPGEQIRQSYAGQIGRFIEPAIAPLGFDWKLGIGLITSFAAREVLVSTLATIYNVEGSDENSVNLREALRNEVNPETGAPRYTPLVAISLMVFFVLACQCMSTVAIVRRETNSWRWPLIMIAYMTLLAYVGSFIVYQGGMLMGFS